LRGNYYRLKRRSYEKKESFHLSLHLESVYPEITLFLQKLLTGGGSGNSGSNIDIEIYNDNDEAIVQEIKKVLEKRYPKIHLKMIVNGKNMPLS